MSSCEDTLAPETAHHWAITAESVHPFSGARHRFVQAELAGTYDGGPISGLQAPALGIPLRITLYSEDSDLLRRLATGLAAEFEVDPSSIECVQQACAFGQSAVALLWLVQSPVAATHTSDGCRIVRQPGIEWATSTCASPDQQTDSLDMRAERAFVSVNTRLAQSGFGFRDWLRTWIYIGGIHEGRMAFGNYQLLNLGRERFFRSQALGSESSWGFPASTGIGADADLCVSALAVRTGPGVSVRTIENARQTSAYRYPEEKSEVPPLFSRAIALDAPDARLVLVSGTASIVGSESVHVGDVEAQTRQTIANIHSLLHSAWEVTHEDPSQPGVLHETRYCVVYVKRPEDASVVRSICEQHFPPDVPVVYTVAHVCRADLLMEIECLALQPSSCRN